MSGMDFEFTVGVNGTGALLELAAAARNAEDALEGVRDANLELGAASAEAAAGIAAQSAALDAAAASVRDLDRNGLTQLNKRISQGAAAAREMGAGFSSTREEIRGSGDAMRQLEEDSRRMGLSASAAGITAAGAIDDYRSKLEEAQRVAADAARGIDDLQNTTSRPGLARIAASHGIKDAIKDVQVLEKEATQGGGFLKKSLSGMLQTGQGWVTSAAGTVFSPMGALIAGAAGLAAGAVPAVLSLGGGFAAFGAMAAPALYKVKTGLSEVAYAQQQYQLAKGVQARNPTKGNLAAEHRTLAALKSTWAQMPGPVRGAVSEIRQFGRAWSQASRKSGIQKDALGDIRLAVQDAKKAIPVITTLAHAFQPVAKGFLKDLGKEVQSKGFKDFIHTLKQDMGPAAHALKGIGGAVGGFITDLTKREAKPGTEMLQSIGHFLKTITPGAVSGLVGLTHGITGFFKALSTVAGSKQVSNLVGDVQTLFTGLHNVYRDASKGNLGALLHDMIHFGDQAHDEIAKAAKGAKAVPVGVKVKPHVQGGSHGFLGLLSKGANAIFGSDTTARDMLHRKVPVDVRIKPRIDPTGLGNSLTGVRSSLTKAFKTGQHAVQVRIKADHGDIAKQVQAAAKSGGSIPLKGKVTLSGLAAGIKSQIASLHIPDSKVKLSIQVTGAGQARSAVSQVVGAARKAAAGAAAALGGLGAAGAHAGAALSAGLASGINAGAGAVAAAARHVAGIAAAAMAIEAEIHSPSRKAERIGKQIDLGLVKGLLGGQSEIAKAASMITGKAIPFKDTKIAATIRKLRADVRKAFREHQITKGQRDDYTDYIDRGNRRLMGLAQQRAKIEAQITAATKLAASVRQSAIASADITGLAANVDAQKNKGYGGGTIAAGQKDQLAKIREFTRDIRKLKKEGLDKTSIKQLLAAGVSGGLPAAQQLLAGGPAGVKETAKLQKQIIDASRKLGITGANAAYESGSQIGKGLAAGLRSELKGIEQAMAQLARHLVNELRKELGLPPLKGGKGGLGLGGGGGGHHKPKHPGGGGVQMLPGGGHLFDGGPGGMQMHPGGTAVHVHVHNTTVLDGRVISTSVQTHSLRRARRNVATGLKLANRAI